MGTLMVAGIKGMTGEQSDFVSCTFVLNGVTCYTTSDLPVAHLDGDIDPSGTITLRVIPPSGYVFSHWLDVGGYSFGSSNPTTIHDYASFFYNKYGQTIESVNGYMIFYAFLERSGQAIDLSSLMAMMIVVMMMSMLMKAMD